MKNQILLLIVLLSFGMCYSVQAQTTLNPDAAYKVARELIQEGKYLEGRKLAFRAIDAFPNYADILILIGRSYSWEGKNDSASIYFERALLVNPTYEDAYSGYLDNLIWSEDYEGAGRILQQAKSNYGTALPQVIAFRESRLLFFRKEYDAAYEIADQLFKMDFKQEGFLRYIQSLQRLRRMNAVGTTYDYDTFFGSISPWNTFSLYGRTFSKFTGPLIARATQSSRFGGSGTLFEVDAYPSLGKNTYGFVNLGVSGASFFPKLRFGASIFHNFAKGWEVDAGYRYLQFSSVTNIYTGSMGKYVGNWWLNFRLNVIPQKSGLATSGNFQARYYFKTVEDFFSIQLSTGISPDEESRDLTQLLNSYRARLGYQQMISPSVMIFGFTGYSIDELGAGRVRNNLNLSFGAEYRF